MNTMRSSYLRLTFLLIFSRFNGLNAAWFNGLFQFSPSEEDSKTEFISGPSSSSSSMSDEQLKVLEWTELAFFLNPEEQISIDRGWHQLKEYSQSPSNCFKSAAIILQNGCKNIQGVDELEKVRCMLNIFFSFLYYYYFLFKPSFQMT